MIELLAATAALAVGEADVERFVPPVRHERGRTVLPLVFVDGTRVTLRYPPRLRLAKLGVEPYGSGVLMGDSPHPGRSDRVGRDFIVRRGDVEAVMARFEGVPVRTYPGGVSLWDTPPGDAHRLYLAFQFGGWTVLVYDFPPEFDGGAASMTEAERAAWAASMTGRETRRGFLRLSARGPLRLAAAGEHAGPQLSFGSPGGRRWLALVPGRCRPPRDADRLVDGRRVRWSGRFATWCASGEMRVHARGRRAFVGTLIRRLTVR